MSIAAIIFFSILGLFVLGIIFFYCFLKLKERSINNHEEKIKQYFLERTALIPSIFEISKEHINKHDQIFKEVLKLRKRELGEDTRYNDLYKILPTKKLIQHEISFIFKVCNQHPELIKEGKFIYLRKLILEQSGKISKNIADYSESIHSFNRLRNIKNMTIIGFLLPLREKIEL